VTRDTLDWLKRPIAHRGLHDNTHGMIENSASAVAAAITADYAIEVDLQCARDGLPVVFHDRTLERLTAESGPVSTRDAATLSTIPLRNSGDRILSLGELLSLVDGRVPLVLEVKSTWGGDSRYEANITDILRPYPGHVAVMSFDPHSVAALRRASPTLPRGLIAERFADRRYWSELSAAKRFAMRHLFTAAIARPHFIAYDIKALPAVAPALARGLFGLPLLAWTVCNEAEKLRALRYADAMIFEGVVP
jgi:glycerophosphoryl diester phosphodiesterase